MDVEQVASVQRRAMGHSRSGAEVRLSDIALIGHCDMPADTPVVNRYEKDETVSVW